MIFTDRFNENKEKVLGIISKNFSYTKESVDRMRELYSSIDRIDEKYLEILGDDAVDMKKEFKIEDSILEDIDKGFIYFYAAFPTFCAYYKITYENFRTWKVLIEKNQMKLRKIMGKFYSSPETFKFAISDLYNLSHQKFNAYFDKFNNMNDILKNEKSFLMDEIDRRVEKVGEMKLPSKDLYITLSFDFSDWFFASTAESWGSCINLDSNYSACYWHGLPALLGDKSRGFIYVGDGTRKSKFGIETDKFLSRSWLILDTDDNINVIKAYPSKMFGASSVNKITGETSFRENTRSAKAKHKLEKLYCNNGYADFIYIDDSSMDRTWRMHLNPGHGGHYAYNEGNGVSNVNLFNYQNGVSTLIEHDKNITQMGGDNCIKSCYHCDTFIPLGTAMSERDYYSYGHDESGREIYYCKKCYDELFKKCSHCGNRHPVDKMEEVNGKLYCKNCFSREFFKCEVCGNIYKKNEKKCHSFRGKNNNLCDDCFSYHIGKCDECSSLEEEKKLLYINDQYYCYDCAKENNLLVKCDTCGGYHLPEDVEIDLSTIYKDDNTFICKKCLKEMSDRLQTFMEFTFEEE